MYVCVSCKLHSKGNHLPLRAWECTHVSCVPWQASGSHEHVCAGIPKSAIIKTIMAITKCRRQGHGVPWGPHCSLHGSAPGRYWPGNWLYMICLLRNLAFPFLARQASCPLTSWAQNCHGLQQPRGCAGRSTVVAGASSKHGATERNHRFKEQISCVLGLPAGKLGRVCAFAQRDSNQAGEVRPGVIAVRL